MPTTPVRRWTYAEVVPIYPGGRQLAPLTTFPHGQVVAESQATQGTVGPYDHLDLDLKLSFGVMQIDAVTDAVGGYAVGDFFGVVELAAPVWVAGYFRMGDLVGLTANVITDSGNAWQVVSGSIVAGGVLSIVDSGR
jgi:hypothetical protein